ncbi:MAG: DUF2784 family protein [Alphaproteobacteria bacterium]
MTNQIIADIILIIHFLIIFFVISLFLLIPISYKLNWEYLKNKTIRVVHISLITLVTIETLIGVHCPLTILENKLRGIFFHTSFISKILKEIIFWELPGTYFLTTYILCFLWTIFLWWRYPPKKKNV